MMNPCHSLPSGRATLSAKILPAIRQLTRLGCLCVALVLSAGAHAGETKNGLQVEVVKRTASRNDARSNYYGSKAIDRSMALHVVAKNVSMKPMPEGEIQYSMLVRKHYTSPPAYEIYTGTAKLPALKPAQSADVDLGGAQITGWQDVFGAQSKDKLEYKVVIKHDGAETIRIVTMTGFDTVAARARKMTSAETKP